MEVLHKHVTAAMLDGRIKIFLQENEFNFSGEIDLFCHPAWLPLRVDAKLY
jgi:cell wall assembly regulator SMI1